MNSNSESPSGSNDAKTEADMRKFARAQRKEMLRYKQRRDKELGYERPANETYFEWIRENAVRFREDYEEKHRPRRVTQSGASAIVEFPRPGSLETTEAQRQQRQTA